MMQRQSCLLYEFEKNWQAGLYLSPKGHPHITLLPVIWIAERVWQSVD
jgi:hypothetical protein